MKAQIYITCPECGGYTDMLEYCNRCCNTGTIPLVECFMCQDTHYEYMTYGFDTYTLPCSHCRKEQHKKQKVLLEIGLKSRLDGGDS